MKTGDKAQRVRPPETACDAEGALPAVPPNSVLDFEVRLLSIVKQAIDGGRGFAPRDAPRRETGGRAVPGEDANTSSPLSRRTILA